MGPFLRPPAPVSTEGVAPGARLEEAVRVVGHRSRTVRTLQRVSFTAEPAALTAVVGPAGSGKSTLLRCLSGQEHLTSGRAFVGDIDLTSLRSRPRRRLCRARIARLSGASTSEVDWFTTVLGAPASADDGAGWVAAVRDLACSPKLILVDDVIADSELPAFLRRLVDAFGQTVVMATQDPSVAAAADHTVCLSEGRVVGCAGGMAA